MDKQILKQLPDIRKEVRDLEQAVTSLEKRIKVMKRDEVYDTVTGSRADLTIGPIKVRGHPQKEYRKRLSELQKKKTLMEMKKTELLQLENEAEEYIQSIQDSGLRRIMRYRYVDDLSWQQVANKMGWRYTSDSYRKRVERFLSD